MRNIRYKFGCLNSWRSFAAEALGHTASGFGPKGLTLQVCGLPWVLELFPFLSDAIHSDVGSGATSARFVRYMKPRRSRQSLFWPVPVCRDMAEAFDLAGADASRAARKAGSAA